MTKSQKQAEKAKIIEDMKAHIAPGDTLYTIVRHRSASGMYRAVDVYQFKPEVQSGISLGVTRLRWTWSIAKVLNYRYDTKHEAIGVKGCGFSAECEIVSDLASVLFGNRASLRQETI